MDDTKRPTSGGTDARDRPVLAVGRWLSAGLLVVAIVLAGPAHAQGGEADEVDVRMRPVARIVDDGFGLVVHGRARCPVGFDVLEANVTVQQDGVASDAGSFGVPCDGRWHRWRSTIPVFDDVPYARGRAFGSAFVLAEDPEGITQLFDNDTREVRLVVARGPR